VKGGGGGGGDGGDEDDIGDGGDRGGSGDRGSVGGSGDGGGVGDRGGRSLCDAMLPTRGAPEIDLPSVYPGPSSTHYNPRIAGAEDPPELASR